MMTLTERMNTINGDPIYKYTFKEACNKRLKTMGTHNEVDYSNIGLNEYTPQEVLNIIYKSNSLHALTLTEVLNVMISNNTNKRKYTAKEALNQIGDLTTFNNGIPS
jgi:hypothetical protein